MRAEQAGIAVDNTCSFPLLHLDLRAAGQPGHCDQARCCDTLALVARL
ncbi:MAG TPA: hypothetical protein VIK79_07470 [Xanthobacteraceae bacterium]